MTFAPRSSRYLIRRLFRTYIVRYKKQLAIALSGMVLAGMMTAANAYMMKPVLDDIFIERDESKPEPPDCHQQVRTITPTHRKSYAPASVPSMQSLTTTNRNTNHE